VTEKQKADCEYLVFGPKVLTAVAVLMMATARVGLKSGTLNLYLSTQKPDFLRNTLRMCSKLQQVDVAWALPS
jgi:hypothetical protein